MSPLDISGFVAHLGGQKRGCRQCTVVWFPLGLQSKAGWHKGNCNHRAGTRTGPRQGARAEQDPISTEKLGFHLFWNSYFVLIVIFKNTVLLSFLVPI